MKTERNYPVLMEAYRWTVVVGGFCVLAYAVRAIFAAPVDPDLFLLLAFTAFVASRININLPKFHGTITLSDAFIFLALLMWGAPAAILAAAVDSFASTLRIRSRLVRTYLFNLGASACATWLTTFVVFAFYGDPTEIARTPDLGSFALALCLIALTHYLGSMLINSVMQALKLGRDLWKTWSTYYLWSCLTFFVGAALAGIIIKLTGTIGLSAVLLVSPVILLVYQAYRSYLRSHDALQESEARFRSSFDYATIGMALVSPDGRWLQVNESLKRILSAEEEELLSAYYQDSLASDDLPGVIRLIQQLADDRIQTFQTEVRFQTGADTEVWGSLGVSTARDLHGNLRHFIFQVQDITLRKRAEEKLRYDARHDALTGLPNRKALLGKLKKILAPSADQRERRMYATLFLDLDGFKIINDSLGHHVGDELLREIAGRLRKCTRPHDTVARLGGDEFTILLERVDHMDQIVMVAERVLESVARPVVLQGHEVSVNVSIGIATSELNYSDPNDMLRDADAAMYQAKARGKGCYVVFDEDMLTNATRDLRLANDLRKAIDNGELELYYQAVRKLTTNEICRFEALVRWNHPRLGLLMPKDFVPLAEENGLITRLDNWTLEAACRQMRKWQTENPERGDLTVSVNASSKQFAQADFTETVRRVLLETELEPHRLQLEITETAMAKNIRNTARVLRRLNEIGVQIALDDFGTGYSSLNYLHELPISTLKIDRSFVMRMDSEANGTEIVRTIISLAKCLGMEVVAEGVETNEQLVRLREIGCEIGQGYLFSRPLPAEQAVRLVTPAAARTGGPAAAEEANRLRLVAG